MVQFIMFKQVDYDMQVYIFIFVLSFEYQGWNLQKIEFLWKILLNKIYIG